MKDRPAPALFIAVLLAACGPSAGGTTTGSVDTTSTIPPAALATTAAPPTTPVPTPPTARAGEITLALPSVSELSQEWQELFVLPYGDAESELGTAPGGDAGSLDLGPDYGAQAPDGTWWVLDAAKRRLAHFSDRGAYLEAVLLEPQHLVSGQFFQFQLPRVLDDGTLVASRLAGSLLLLRDGDLHINSLSQVLAVKTDDGSSLYGFSDTGALLRVDPYSAEMEDVEWFRTRADTRFRIASSGDLITVELPDASETIRLRLVYAGDPSIPAYVAIEAASGEDGSLFLYLYGGTDRGEGGQLGGYLSITTDGLVSALEPTRDPFSPSDPGSPAHLGVRPGTSDPWLMFVDTDGVRVFARSAVRRSESG